MSDKQAEFLRVVLVDEEFPYPINSGKRIRTLNLVKELAKKHRILYVAQANQEPSELDSAKEYLNELGVETLEVPRAIPSKSGIGFYARLFVNLFSKMPYSVISHQNPKLHAALKKISQTKKVDIWHCEWTPYLEYFRRLDVKPVVVTAHNVESLIWKRYAESETSIIKSWYIKKQWKKFELFEKWAFHRADKIVTVSEQDSSLAKIEFGAASVGVVENGVDFEAFSSHGEPRLENSILFLGSLDWRPNLDGLQHFIRTSFSKVLKEYPEVTLKIVGRNAPSWLLSLGERDSHIEVHSNVPDAKPFLCEATIMVVPLRIGGGSRLKIIEAAANQLPVVTTKIGAEGLNFKHDEEYFYSEDIEHLHIPLIKALSNAGSRKEVAKKAFEKASKEYGWDRLATVQDSIWRSVCSIKD